MYYSINLVVCKYKQWEKAKIINLFQLINGRQNLNWKAVLLNNFIPHILKVGDKSRKKFNSFFNLYLHTPLNFQQLKYIINYYHNIIYIILTLILVLLSLSFV